jgi:hypothetical protein
MFLGYPPKYEGGEGFVGKGRYSSPGPSAIFTRLFFTSEKWKSKEYASEATPFREEGKLSKCAVGGLREAIGRFRAVFFGSPACADITNSDA